MNVAEYVLVLARLDIAHGDWPYIVVHAPDGTGEIEAEEKRATRDG